MGSVLAVMFGRVKERERMFNNFRSLAEDRRRQLAFSLLEIKKREKNVASVTLGQLCRLQGAAWKHPQCLKVNQIIF